VYEKVEARQIPFDSTSLLLMMDMFLSVKKAY